MEQVHFHEIGAVDTLVDIVGFLHGLQDLGIRRLYSSPLPLGRGLVSCAHGRLPLPAPAVCELLKGIPVYGSQDEEELLTPTAAALITSLADGYGALPPMTINATGYGAGRRESGGDTANLLRIFIGRSRQAAEEQVVEIIETNIDDMSPEIYPHLYDRLFAHGALDINLIPSQMKKGRPGFILQVISPPLKADMIKECILTETTAIGLRFHGASRLTLSRETITVSTPWGEVSAKRVLTPKGLRVYPEHEECRRLAMATGIPLIEIHRAVGQGGSWTG